MAKGHGGAGRTASGVSYRPGDSRPGEGRTAGPNVEIKYANTMAEATTEAGRVTILVDPRGKVIDVEAMGHGMHHQVAQRVALDYSTQLGMSRNEILAGRFSGDAGGWHMVRELDEIGFVHIRGWGSSYSREPRISLTGKNKGTVTRSAKRLAKGGAFAPNSMIELSWREGGEGQKSWTVDELLY